MRNSPCLIGYVALIVLLSAGSAGADAVNSVTGNGELVAPPPSAVLGAFPSLHYIVFDERTGILASAVTLDEAGTAQGGHDGLSSFVPVTLLPGTHYATTMIQLNPEKTGTVHSGTAVIHFSTQILGIALRGVTLSATDVYGNLGTIYPPGYAPLPPDNRGIDLRKNDRFTIAANGYDLIVQFTANNLSSDQIRVFTAGVPKPVPGVPEPKSSVMLLFGFAGIVASSVVRRRPSRPKSLCPVRHRSNPM